MSNLVIKSVWLESLGQSCKIDDQIGRTKAMILYRRMNGVILYRPAESGGDDRNSATVADGIAAGSVKE